MNLTKKKIGLIIGAILVTIFIVGFFFATRSYIGNDEGSYLYEPTLVLLGKIPFKDFISRAPTEIYLFALIFKIFGNGIVVIKIINTLIVTAIGVMVYLIVRQYQKRNLAIIAAAVALLNAAFILPALVVNTTSLSILLILLSCYILKKDGLWDDAFAGSLLALAVFTREINAIFVLFLLIFFITTRNWKKLYQVSLGGIVTSIFVIGFFAYHTGLYLALTTLLGLGHIGVEEEKMAFSYSLSILEYFILCLTPLFVYFLVLKKDFSKLKLIYPEILWVFATGIFYIYYFTKRGFMLSYGTEFIPLIVIIVFTLCIFDISWPFTKKRYPVILPSLLILTILPFALVRPISIKPMNSIVSLHFNINRLVGGGIPIDNFSKINKVIQGVTKPNDTILTGNLAFITENKLRQFMDISRPMAYNRSSEVYSMYNAPTPTTITNQFFLNPPKIIVEDRHLVMSFWIYMQSFVLKNYKIIYADDYVLIFELRDVRTQSQILPMTTVAQ